MKTSRLRIASAVADKTLKSGSSKAYARSIAAYLLEEGRAKELDSLLRDVRRSWADKGYVEVVASSAYPLAAAARTDISKRAHRLYPNATKVVVTEVIDRSVVGGVQIVVVDKQLDLSVEAKLHKFKQLTGSKL